MSSVGTLTVTTGGITVTTGGIAVTGNSTINGIISYPIFAGNTNLSTETTVSVTGMSSSSKVLISFYNFDNTIRAYTVTPTTDLFTVSIEHTSGSINHTISYVVFS
jgi:hypothetical protein